MKSLITYLRFSRAGIVLVAIMALVLAACETTSPQPELETLSVNLKRGAVYSMSNDPDGNEVVAFSRAPDGTLTPAGSFATGGTGSGSFEDVANSLVLGSARGEASPNNLIGASNLLFATNAGSNSISVFKVNKEGLELVEVQDSGGEKPVSVTVNKGLLYVLHSGETEDDLFDEDGNLIAPNCTTGSLPSITGFTVSNDGQLTPIPNSTRSLSGDPFSGCAQVSFNPRGDVLVVTERTAVEPGQTNNRVPAGDEGVILTFTVNDDGTLGNKQIFDATGQGPFGFTFSKDGLLLTSEQFDGPFGPDLGAAAAYALDSDGNLTATSASVGNGGTDSCWFVVTDDGKLGFVASFFDPSPRISSYRITPQGDLELIEGDAAIPEQGAADLALSRDSKYLYNINAFTGMVSAYEVGKDGSLDLIQSVQAHEPSGMAGRFGLAAN